LNLSTRKAERSGATYLLLLAWNADEERQVVDLVGSDYPFHMNRDVLSRLLKERTVLVLPNISGFQQKVVLRSSWI
ncbi:MAG TPA: hypothetical protein VIG25_09335, partial [Pyrinomonadaceae bacterium]